MDRRTGGSKGAGVRNRLSNNQRTLLLSGWHEIPQRQVIKDRYFRNILHYSIYTVILARVLASLS